MNWFFTVFEKDFADGWIIRESTHDMEEAFIALGSVMNEGKAVRMECNMEIDHDLPNLWEA